MTTIYKITFTDKSGNETATGKEYKSKAAATRAGNKAVKDSPKPITYRVTEKAVTAADTKAAKEAAALIKKAKGRKAANPAPPATAPAKPAKVDVQKYTAGKASTELKSGTVMAAIVDTVGNKKMTREAITTAVIKSGYAPPKSKEFTKNPAGYISGYLSAAISRKQLVAA